MTESVLQAVFKDQGSFGPTGTTLAQSVTISAGSLIYVAVTCESGFTISVADPTNGSYTPISDNPVDGPNAQQFQGFYFPNAAGGTYTVTATFSGAAGARALVIIELGGAKTVSPLDGHHGVFQSSTNAPSDSATNANQPALIVSVAINSTGDSSPAAGAGFTDNGSGWSFGGAAPALGRAESKRVTSATSQTAAFTSSTTSSYLTLIAIFDETAGAVLAGDAAGRGSASAALTTGIKVAAIAAGLVVASAAIGSGAAIAAAAQSKTATTNALTTGIRPAATASGSTSSTAALINWATVTLTSPLYAGAGSILDPAFWQASMPGVGTVVYYDPTHITISPNGEITADTNHCSAVVEFFDGSAWQIGLVVITPDMVAYAIGHTQGSGALTTGIPLAAVAADRVTASASLGSASAFAATAAGNTVATGALTSGIKLAAAAAGIGSAAAALSTSIALIAPAYGRTIGTAALGSASAFAAAACGSASATAALTSGIRFTAAASGQVSVSAQIGAPAAQLAGIAGSRASALANLTSLIQLSAAASAGTGATGQLSTGVQLSAAAYGKSAASAVVGQVFLVGGPRYVIKRLRARRWSVSATTYLQFDPKNADEKVKLTFDFGDDLDPGMTLIGTPVVTFLTASGSDVTPANLANGVAGLDASSTQVIVPIQGGNVGCTYAVHVYCGTTDQSVALSLTGILPVIS